MPAGAAADACKATSEHPTADVSVEFALHELRHHLASTCDDSREGGAVMTNRAMVAPLAGIATAVALVCAMVPVWMQHR